ncbi:MAG: LysM peptidoglycan-binding domain-containing protein [Chloroflexaceae bacterium]
MSQVLVYTLLVCALIVPVLGVLTLRFLLGDRLSEVQLIRGAAAFFLLAIVSVLVLAFSNVEKLSVGNLELLLPFTGPVSATQPEPAMPVTPPELPPVTAAPPPTLPIVATSTPVTPTVTASVEVTTTATEATNATATSGGTATATATPSATATAAPTATATAEPPSATPEPPSATLEPPGATPEPEPPAEPEPRTYTVEPGDTLRSIAAQFDVSVEALLEANDLTPEEADALRVGQELVIP